jgi:hypothetical protein
MKANLSMTEIIKGKNVCPECGDFYEIVEATEDKLGEKVFCHNCHAFKGVYLIEEPKPSQRAVEKAVKEIISEEEKRVDYI